MHPLPNGHRAFRLLAVLLLAVAGCNSREAPVGEVLQEARLEDITNLLEQNRGKVVLLTFWGLF